MQPPQDPYAQSAYNQPPYPAQSAYAPPPQAPRGTVSMDVISEAWTFLSPNIGPWVLAMLAYFGIPYAIGAVRGIFQLLGQNGGSWFWLVLAVIIQLISWVVTQVLLGGIMKLAISTVQTRVTNINEMWTVTNMGVSLVLSAILQSLIYLVACLPGICVLGAGVFIPLYNSGVFSPTVLASGRPPAVPPGLIGSMLGGILGGGVLIVLSSLVAGALLYLTTALIVHRGRGPLEAISGSFGALKKHFLSSLLLLFVLSLINLGGLMVCCVGMIFTIPLTMIAIALVYRDLFGLDMNVQPATASVPPPIANPNF